MTLVAGFARAELSPPTGLPMGGYAARAGVAVGSLDPLACRVALFRAGGAPLLLAALDLVHLAGPWAAEVRRRTAAAIGGAPERVLLAATHTHSGPAVFRSGATSKDDLGDFEAELAGVVERTARAALDAAAPARLFAGSATVEGVAASRHDAAAPIDDCARALVARRPDGTVAGVLAAFACHPTILPPENLHYSRDLFGAAVDAVEAELGGCALLFNGAAADVSTRFTRRAQSASEVERLGRRLAGGIAAAAATARPLDGAVLDAGSRRIAVTLRQLPDEAEAAARVAAALEALEAAQAASGDAAALRLAFSRVEGAQAQLWLARHGGWAGVFGRLPREAEVQWLDVCGARLVAVPGEVLASAGRRLGAAGATVVGYANDYLGYLVTPSLAGAGEYEALMAALAPASVEALERLCAEVAAHG